VGVARLFLLMFLRKLKNRSGSISVQIILKASGKYKVVKTIGTGSSEQEIVKIWFLGKQELERLHAQSRLFVSENDLIVEQVFESLKNANIRTVGPELVFGRIYDHIGFNAINEDLLRHLVIARLAFKQVKDHRLCISLSTRDARY
jgi:RNA-binding protein YhbY